MAKTNPMKGVDPSLSKLGFSRIKPVRRKRISMEVSGKTKTGKTRLALTMTPPIGLINTDRSLEDILPEFPDVDLVVKDLGPMFSPGQPLSQKQAQQIEAQFSSAYDALLESHVRSIVVDKFTTIWEVARFAEFGVASVKAHHYVPVNLRMRGYIGKFQQHDKNLLLIHEVKEEWKNEQPTGRWIVDGFKYTPGLVQVNGFMDREEGGGDFILSITGCALNAELVGWDFKGEDVNWPNLASMVMPETKKGDWQ